MLARYPAITSGAHPTEQWCRNERALILLGHTFFRQVQAGCSEQARRERLFGRVQRSRCHDLYRGRRASALVELSADWIKLRWQTRNSSN
jgi:hypothetical protein